MTKKIFATAAAAVLALGLAGCSKEEEKAEETAAPEPTEEAIEEPVIEEETEDIDFEMDSNLPLTIDEWDEYTTYQLNNGAITLTVPNYWILDENIEEDVPIMLYSDELGEGYLAVSEVGSADIIPAAEEYAGILTESLGLEDGSVLYLGETDIDYYPADTFEIDLGGFYAYIYLVIVEDTAYEITTWGVDSVYAEDIELALYSVVLG
ncbi:MAG: hypothetical protein GX483_08420 [Actinomycetaceae bacterium]|nr:hypothetical protein [Actinomycetaceae bacterium]